MYLILDTIHTSAMVGTAMKMISFWAKVSTIYTESKLRVSILQLYLHNTIDHCNPILRFSVINLQIITTVTYIYILLRPVSSATSASDVLKSQSQFLIMKYSTHIGNITILIWHRLIIRLWWQGTISPNKQHNRWEFTCFSISSKSLYSNWLLNVLTTVQDTILQMLLLLLFIHTVCTLIRVWQDQQPPPLPGEPARWQSSPPTTLHPHWNIWPLKDRPIATLTRTQGEIRKGRKGTTITGHRCLPAPEPASAPPPYCRSVGRGTSRPQ